MKTEEETNRRVLGVIHRSMPGLHRLGLVSDAEMRELEETCVAAEVSFDPAELKALRAREGVTQASLARHLGVATATVRQWERGQRRPDGPAAKLLSLVKANGLKYIS